MDDETYKVVKKINLEDSTDFWNLDENSGYRKFRASDGRDYKVWIGNKNQTFQKSWWYTVTNQQETAETLAKVRKDLETLLNYIYNNADLWSNNPIAFGIYHTFDLHLNKQFEYLETRPNQDGILGLNKPKELTVLEVPIDNKKINYELGTKRNIMLTLRNQNTGELRNYKDILDLAIHELTHTTCNDVRWIPESKGGNHRDPYPSYHRLMRTWARECGII
uniref:Uncharacterized protein n=1 Tax=viral metagenome TaxID=1070528 RepID=A0A6C0B114_9ZZZZ